jgi:hypothetical protein
MTHRKVYVAKKEKKMSHQEQENSRHHATLRNEIYA